MRDSFEDGGGGGGMNEVLDGYDSAMLANFNVYRSIILTTWDGFVGNPGQMSIVKNHIMPVSVRHVQDAKDEWPWSDDPDGYMEQLYSGYDSDVLARAFGETINNLYDSISELWVEADDWQQRHDEVLGYSAVHSTNPPWVA